MVATDNATLVRLFRESGQKYPTVDYDVDDVLWDLIGRVAARKGIPYRLATAIFSIRNNKLLTTAQQDAIIAAFSDPSIFRDIDFFDGVADILRPRELGARVRINSNSFSQAIADLKKEQILRAVPELHEDDLQFNIISYGSTHSKKFADDMTIFVDDSPHNVAQSPALINIMPMTVPWSFCQPALDMTAAKPVIWKPNLTAINSYIYELVAEMMQITA